MKLTNKGTTTTKAKRAARKNTRVGCEDTQYTKYIKDIEKNIPRTKRIPERNIKKIFEPIRVERAYISGIANPETNLYYSRDFEKYMFQKYSEDYNGHPPIILRNPNNYKKSKNEFIFVRSESMLGYIVDCQPTYFMVEPKGVRSRRILEYIVENGYKAVYEFLSQTRQTSVYDGKTDKYIEVNELYGRSKIVCVNMVKK